LRQERLFIVDKVIDNHKEIVSYMHLDCSPDQYIVLSTIATKKNYQGLVLARVLLQELPKYPKPIILWCA
jgi:hypothetical protein